MNEQLQSKLVEILTAMQEAAKAGGDFAMSQLPDIAQSYVLYGRVVQTVGLLVWLFAFAVLMHATCRFGYFNRTAVDKYGDWNEGRVYACMAGTAGSIVAFFGVCIQISSAALVWLAPKVWLLKEIARLLK